MPLRAAANPDQEASANLKDPLTQVMRQEKGRKAWKVSVM
jgi:hypothetical protein